MERSRLSSSKLSNMTSDLPLADSETDGEVERLRSENALLMRHLAYARLQRNEILRWIGIEKPDNNTVERDWRASLVKWREKFSTSWMRVAEAQNDQDKP